MSRDSHFTLQRPHLIDLVDREWALDKLEDDDISLPMGVELSHDDTELLESVDPREKSKNDKDKWADFGLEDILERT